MKKAAAIISAAILSAMCLFGCGAKEIDLTEASNSILTGTTFAEELQPTSENIALKRLGVDASSVESCVAYASTNAVVDEFAVIKATDTAAVETAIRNHIASQIEIYQSYAPDEVAKLNSAVVAVSGDYVIYVVSSDSASAQSVVDSIIK
ncbi:MAG TPA: DUF4358 domain-containing protein [Candidatus Ornithomonoglobus intestinigallinarum]|uniref:DUF4358 domain-containing protein n=1 Tax=Candidatus Ornithomonoglobus intestinigallinarum TaxID=2840894 RepID=A0A9D1H4Q7_9FIRM|nr:DUF4358 domain-containing protein [Candidatus Ornithomonoglobus intestinigallinarum]